MVQSEQHMEEILTASEPPHRMTVLALGQGFCQLLRLSWWSMRRPLHQIRVTV